LKLELPSAARAIIQTVAEQNDIHIGAITGKTNEPHPVFARRMAARLLADQGYTLSEIGRFLGGRHHTTIHHLLNTASPTWRKRQVKIEVTVSQVSNHLEEDLLLRLQEIEANRAVIRTKLQELDVLEAKVRAMLAAVQPPAQLEVVA
jgi:glucan phosphorylase